jgi:hypothetical protein
MNATYDHGADAAYIYLTKISRKGVSRTYACDPREVNGWYATLAFVAAGIGIVAAILHSGHEPSRSVIELGAAAVGIWAGVRIVLALRGMH